MTSFQLTPFLASLPGLEPGTYCLEGRADIAKLLNKLTVSQLAELSKLSKSYCSQVKNGKRSPSARLLDAIRQASSAKNPEKDYFRLFLASRQAMGVSPRTLGFYRERLTKFIARVNPLKATRKDIERYLNTIPPNENGLATRHASFRTMKTFYRWLADVHGIPNAMGNMPAPILSKVIMPSLSQEQVSTLIEKAQGVRDKAIIAVFVESGLRLSELAAVKPETINWDDKTIKVLGKGRKEAYAPFGQQSERYLKEWLAQYQPNSNVWGLNQWGIASMLRRLEAETDLPCNPHTFRRTFACLLRKGGVDVLTIKDLGRWESLEMVQRYTRSVTFHDSLKLYKAPLS
ncbi:MAG: helix-turn-helix domain-containing protein [Chloroflexi bacterium]|nr:helix-turn-helix domain-containing protein [Chloroflexota bacterium]